jgi:hypothetical protein
MAIRTYTVTLPTGKTESYRSSKQSSLSEAVAVVEAFIPVMGELGLISSIDHWTHEIEILDSTGQVYKKALIHIN